MPWSSINREMQVPFDWDPCFLMYIFYNLVLTTDNNKLIVQTSIQHERKQDYALKTKKIRLKSVNPTFATK